MRKYSKVFLLLVGIVSLSHYELVAKNSPEDSVQVNNQEQKRALNMSRLLPKSPLKVVTGDEETDNIFNNYSISQIQIIVDEYEKKYEKAKEQKRILTETSLELGEKFIKVFQDSKVIDEVAMRYADLLYDKLSEEYYAKRAIYDQELVRFLQSNEFKEYQKKVEAFYQDTSGTGTPPQKPKGPEAPDPKLDRIINIYDKIINDLPESPYVADALYGKAFILGERYADYLPLLEQKYNGDDRKAIKEVEDKKNESMTLLQQLSRRYPDSRYTVDAYMLIGEYLFGSKKNQPRKTREAIPYYKKALELISKRGQRSDYYYQAVYKLAWCYYRLGVEEPNEYREAVIYLTQLIDDIEKAEEVYLGKVMPPYVRPDMKNEAMDIMVTCFLQLQRIDNQSTSRTIGSDSTGVERLDRYFGSSKVPRRYAPLIYEKLAEQYTELKENPLKINSIYFALLKRYPKYERAPRIAQRVIDQYKLITENGELQGEAKDKGLEILYEQRNNLFYVYGRNSEWFQNMKRRIDAQKKGRLLSFEDQSVFTSGFDISVLAFTDSISKEALFQNILYSSSRAQVLEEGREATEYSEAIRKDTIKSKVLYQKTVDDIEQYAKLFSRYDSISYYTQFQRAIILEDKLGKIDDALKAYMSIARNFAWDEMPYPLREDSLISYRKYAIGRAYEITNSICEAKKIGFSDPTIDTATRASNLPPLEILPEEQKFIDVVDNYIRLYPHDTVSAFAIFKLANFYRAKGYNDKYKEVNSRLVLYYPIQPIYPSTIVPLMYAAYESGDFSRSEQLAKALYYGPKSGTKQDSLIRREGYRYVGSSINERAKLYESKKNYFAAAKEYERAALSVPDWEYVDEALMKAAETYDSAKATNDAVRLYNYLIKNAKFKKNVVRGYSGIVNSYKLASQYDSVTSSLERISDVYSLPEADTIGLYQVYKVKKDGESFAENALFQSLKTSELVSEKTNNWNNSIRLSDKFLARYPNSPNASKIAFNKIEQFRKSGNMKGVEEAYGQFADNYPDDPLGVYAYFRRGEMREKELDTTGAKTEFGKVIARQAELKQKKKDNGSTQIYSAESIYKLKNYQLSSFLQAPIKMIILDKAFEEIKISDEPSQSSKTVASTKKTRQQIKQDSIAKLKRDTIRAIRYDSQAKDSKKKFLDSLIFALAGSNTYRSIDAFYSDAYLNEEVALQYEKLPDTLKKAKNREGKQIPAGVAKAGVEALANDDAANFFGNAGVSYITTIKKMLAFRDDFLKNPTPDSAKEFSKELYSILNQKATGIDLTNTDSINSKLLTLKPLVDRWISEEGKSPPDSVFLASIEGSLVKARRKVSEMYFKAAKLKEKNAYLFLDIPVPIDIKNKVLRRTVGKGRTKSTIDLFIGDVLELTVLSRFAKEYVQPYAESAINTYKLGVSRTKEKGLGLDQNSEYIKDSEKAIIRLASLSVERVDSIARLALGLFDNLDREYRNRLDSIKNQTAGDTRFLSLRSAKMQQVITVFNALVNDALGQYSKAFQLLRESNSADTLRIANKASKFVYELGELSLHRSDSLIQRVKRYNEIANYFDPQTGENKYWYGEAALQYQPVANLYKSVAQLILQNSVILIDEYQIQNEYTQKSLELLVESDRVKYLRLLGTESIQELLDVSPTGWTYSTSIPEEDTYEWFKNTYPKSNNWQPATVNEEVKKLQIIETKKSGNDTLTSYKDIDVAAIWFTARKVSYAPPRFAVKGDVFNIRMKFNNAGDSILSGRSTLDSVASVIANKPDYLVEYKAGNFEIPTTQQKNYDKILKQRETLITKIFLNAGVKTNQFKLVPTGSERFTSLRLIKAEPVSYENFVNEGDIKVTFIEFANTEINVAEGMQEIDSLAAKLVRSPEYIIELTVSNKLPKLDKKTGKTLRTQTVKERESELKQQLVLKGANPNQILVSGNAGSEETKVKLIRFRIPPPVSYEDVTAIGDERVLDKVKFSYNEKAFKSSITGGQVLLDSLVAKLLREKGLQIEMTVSNEEIPSRAITSGIKQRESEVKKYFVTKGVADKQMTFTGDKKSTVTKFKVVKFEKIIETKTESKKEFKSEVPKDSVSVSARTFDGLFTTIGTQVQLSIQFVKDTEVISSQNVELDSLSSYLNRHSDEVVEITTSNFGINKKGAALKRISDLRNKSVKEFLISKGVKNEQIRFAKTSNNNATAKLVEKLNKPVVMVDSAKSNPTDSVKSKTIETPKEIRSFRGSLRDNQSYVKIFVAFGKDKSELITKDSELDSLIVEIKDRTGYTFEVQPSNQQLTKKGAQAKRITDARALSVVKYLSSNGIPQKQLIINKTATDSVTIKVIKVPEVAKIDTQKTVGTTIGDSSSTTLLTQKVPNDSVQSVQESVTPVRSFEGMLTKKNEIEFIGGLLFDKDKSTIKAGKTIIDSLGSYLARNPLLVVEITISNKEISKKGAAAKKIIDERAKTLTLQLKSIGVDLKNVKISKKSAPEGSVKVLEVKSSTPLIPIETSKPDSIKSDTLKSDSTSKGRTQGYRKFNKKFERTYAMVVLNTREFLQSGTNSDSIPPFVYFKKKFVFNGAIKDAQLVISKDIPFDEDSTEIYINGRLLNRGSKIVYIGGGVSPQDKGDQVILDSTYLKNTSENQAIYDVKNDILPGENYISLRVPGYIPSEGIKLGIYVTYYGKVTDEQLKKLLKVVLEERKKANEKLKEAELEQIRSQQNVNPN
ncbi:MAG: tetratricopeptide repeat protein [Chloroherpetonaceae bacterium]|nr:tetratricopeptide repeat protein [Chloroherpetonaceae bacterium]